MISLITPTGARPQQIELCAHFMKNQTYKGKVTWIIVDDALPVTTSFIKDDFRENWEIIKIFPSPAWQPGQNTQARNISAGISELSRNFNMSEIEAIYIIEDDDYYKPIYLEEMQKRIGDAMIIGELYTVYYNVALRSWLRNGNNLWSSLFQTAFKPAAIPYIRECYDKKYIDCHLFQTIPLKRLFVAGDLSIGIKGLPGRKGIGMGHRDLPSYQPDSLGIKLYEFIGDDVKLYIHDWNCSNIPHG